MVPQAPQVVLVPAPRKVVVQVPVACTVLVRKPPSHWEMPMEYTTGVAC
eukprot:CAMPEP_0181316272 /NCGR_PEP_ID=MMETSP1101-20121128/15807_1 /TAXON_ID=46948 /ORGANISM="Rhodomonas abbreviata, Strain Caron Lab Isolate" /LENGTH=48 /DNA_ID= /DNA_START= /DNA_END= /DNA_ORIENTATION=